MVEKILNNTTPYGKIRASYEGSLHSSTLSKDITLENGLHICNNFDVQCLYDHRGNTIQNVTPLYFLCIDYVILWRFAGII